jgi:hypothetical protein
MTGLVPVIHAVQPHDHFSYSWRPAGKAFGAARQPNHVAGHDRKRQENQ